jgi:IS5 family transposase
MLVEKHKPVNLLALVALVPLKWDKILNCLDALLEEDPLFQAVKADLARRYRHTLTRGRHSTPVEVILRMLVVKHLYRWSYEQTETFVADSIILRQFCRVYWQKVPDDTVLNRWANLLQPETLHQLLAHVATMAHRLQVTRGRKLRTDGTVVESDIHLPTDSSLLADGVRVLSRTLGRARRVLQSAATGSVQVAQTLFRNRWRNARNTAREISRAAQQTTQEGKKRSVRLYRKLLGITRTSVQQAQQVVAVLRQETTRQADQLAKQIEHFVPLVEQVVRQATRRVLQGEAVPAQDKLVSLFEPHTDIIRRGKPGRTAEFGHKVWIDEVDGGIVSDYRVLDGNAPDQSQWLPSLERHQQLFGRPPQQMSGDRGMYSRNNEVTAQAAGVRRVILPQAGHRSAARKQYEQQRWFRRGRRYHQGIEGRISVLKRRYGMDRCRDHGESGFERWVGWGIIAHNLLAIGSAVATR